MIETGEVRSLADLFVAGVEQQIQPLIIQRSDAPGSQSDVQLLRG